MPGIKNFKDKVVVVTGAGSGIGRATALAFAREGADMALTDINPEALAAVEAEIIQGGGRAVSTTSDVSDSASVEALCGFVIGKKGRVDILHNNAGVTLGGRLEDTSLDDWRWLMEINFMGAVHGVHYFLPHMIERRYGHIVNTCSFMGLCAAPGAGAYSTSKFAVAGFSEALRAEVRRYNIGVSAICPGVINTGLIKAGRMKMREGARASNDMVEKVYRTRGWPPEKVAGAVLTAVRGNKSVVPVGPEAWANWLFKRFSQRGYDAALAMSDKLLLG